MAHISESIPDLLGGVSQLAPQRREVNEVESMVNCMLRPAEGIVKRPPTKWIAELSATASTYDGAFVHTINKNSTERYWVIVLDGDLKVFNAVTGVEVVVGFPDGKSYLDVVGSPNEAFRLATFNQTTMVVNRETVVDRAAEVSASRGHEALIAIVQTDYDTEYKILIGFNGPPEFNSAGVNTGPPQIPVTVKIGPADQVPTPSLSSTTLAFQLAVELDTAFGVLATLITGDKNLLAVTTLGSTIHIEPGPDLVTGAEFWVSSEDDLGNKGLQVIQKSIQTFDQLPPEAPVGFRIKIEGDPLKSLDDVYFEFTTANTWKETNKSRIPIALDTTTMPMELAHDADLIATKFLAELPTATYVQGGTSVFQTAWLETEDGSATTRVQAIMSPAPNTTSTKFLNIANAAGHAIKMHFTLEIDATQVMPPGPDPQNPLLFYLGDTFTLVVYDDTSGSYVNRFATIIPYSPTPSTMTLDLDFSGDLFETNENVKLAIIANGGNRGSVRVQVRGTSLFSTNLVVDYSINIRQSINIPSQYYAPGTDMTFTLNGTGFVHDFAAGGTLFQYGTSLRTAILAYGGQAISVSFTVRSFPLGTAKLLITNDDGTKPTLTSFTFDDSIDPTTQFFSGGADFVNLGVSVNDTIKNITDGSEAIISGVATTVVTSAPLAGGVDNKWETGDRASAKTAVTSFSLREPDWAKRLVGTEETNKWPSFEDQKINEVAFLKNRLVLISDENVAMSVVDEFFTFFRTSTLDVLDSDRIDVTLAGNKTSSLHSAFTWNEALLVWSELGQYTVTGEPFLSPNTVKREATTAYINTRKVKPVTSERSVYFLTEGQDFVQLWDYFPVGDDAKSSEGNRLSVKVPRYMPGSARGLLAISDPEVVLVLTATDPNKLYVYSHLLQDQQRTMASWHEWTFPGVTQILGMGSIEERVSLVLERDDGKIHLEVLDLWELSEATVDSQTTDGDPATPPSFTGGNTVYTTPLGDSAYSTVIGVESDGTETTLTNNEDGTVSFIGADKTGVTMHIGLPVSSSIELTKLYHRKNFGPYAGKAEVRGQTYINYLLVGLEDTTTMDIAIAITGHVTFNQDLTELRSLDGEYMHCRVGGRNTETTITLSASDASNFKIVGFDWEGIYYNRTRRMS